MSIIHNVRYLNVGLKNSKWHIFNSKDFYLNRRLSSCITKIKVTVVNISVEETESTRATQTLQNTPDG